MPNSVVLGQTVPVYFLYSDPPETMAPRIQPFKVTQGQWNPRGLLATYDFLLVIHSNYGPVS